LERTLFVLCGLAWISRTRRRWLNLLALGITSAALLLTASRGAWLLGIPAGAFAFFTLMTTGLGPSQPRSTRSFGWVVTTLVVSILAALGIAAFLGWERLTNQVTVVDRFAIWRSSAALWRDHMWVGVGPNGFYWHYPAYIPPSAAMDPNLRHPHNLWLEIGGAWGLVGLAWTMLTAAPLIVSMHGLWKRWPDAPAAWRACKPVAGGLIAGFVAGIAHGQVDAFGVLADLAGWNWAAMGLLVTLLLMVEGSTKQKRGRTSQ
jgi:O-antigen ligase